MKYLTITTVFVLIFCSQLSANQQEQGQLDKEVTGANSTESNNEIALRFIKAGDLSQAKRYIEKGLSLEKEGQDKAARAFAYELLGVISKERFDYTNGMQYLLTAHDQWKALKQPSGIASANQHIGQIFYLQQEYIKALEHLNIAVENFAIEGAPTQRAEVSRLKGDVYLAQKFYGKAKAAYTEAFDIFVDSEKYVEAAGIARFLGKVNRDLGDYESAIVYFSTSLDLHGTVEDLSNIAIDYNDLTLTYLEQDNYEEALENNAIAYELRSELIDTIGLSESMKNFGLIYARLGEDNKAVSYLSKAGTLLSAKEVSTPTPLMFEEIADAFSGMNNFKEAYKYERLFSESQKALFNQDKATALLELTTRYESETEAEEQRQQITLLEKDKIASSRIRGFLLALIGLIASLLGLLFYHFQRKKKDNRLLTAKNEEIIWQKEEINRKNIQLEEKAASLDLLNNKLVSEMAERESIERSSFARDSFLAMMSHQMRTPINIIVGLTHLLLEENPREDQRESLRNLQFSANNLVVFINDVLDYSKIEAGKLVMQNRAFKLLQVIEDVHKWSYIPAEEKDVTLKFSIEKTVPEILIGDPARLNQILTNLISSSLNYTENELIQTKISLQQLSDKEVTLEIEIKDNGRGIEKAKLEEMFRKFTRDPEADIYDGFNTSGLELAITKRLVDLQNGRIEAASELGKGTTFKVYLPFTMPSKNSDTSEESNKTHLPYHYLVGKKIMVVEDNKINQLVVRKMLKKLGIIVTTADNGLESLDRIQEEYFDLILMDIQMPKMDGYRATAEIRKSEDPKIANVPIIALTASAYLTQKEKAQLFGMDDHVGKPFGPEELMEKISNCLASREKNVNVIKNNLN